MCSLARPDHANVTGVQIHHLNSAFDNMNSSTTLIDCHGELCAFDHRSKKRRLNLEMLLGSFFNLQEDGAKTLKNGGRHPAISLLRQCNRSAWRYNNRLIAPHQHHTTVIARFNGRPRTQALAWIQSNRLHRILVNPNRAGMAFNVPGPIFERKSLRCQAHCSKRERHQPNKSKKTIRRHGIPLHKTFVLLHTIGF